MFVAGIGLTSNVSTRLEAVNVTEDGLAERISSCLLHSRAEKTDDKYRAYLRNFNSFVIKRTTSHYLTIFISNLSDQKC